jgi:hypothetical protein
LPGPQRSFRANFSAGIPGTFGPCQQGHAVKFPSSFSFGHHWPTEKRSLFAVSRVWNRIPAAIHDQIIELALEQSELSPRELAVRFTDETRYFVSEASVYRLLKAHDLIASPAYVVIKAANEFHTKTTRPNEMWQTDFTYFKIIGWGWMYLATVLDDYSRLISSPGSCAARCEPMTSPTRWTWRSRLQGAIKLTSITNLDCSATTARATWQANWPIISRLGP